MNISAADVKKLRDLTGAGMMTCKEALTEAGGDLEKAIENLRKAGAAKAAKRAEREANEGKIAILVSDSSVLIWEVNSETDFVSRNEDFLDYCKALGPILLQEKPGDIDEALALEVDAFGGRSVSEKQTELIGKIGENISFSRFAILPVAVNEKAFSYIHGNGKIGVAVILTGDGAALATDAAAELGKDLAMQIAAFNPVAIKRDDVPSDIVAKEKEIYADQVRASGKPENIIEKIVTGKLDKFFEETVLLEQAFVKDTGKTVDGYVREMAAKAGSALGVKQFIRYQIGQ
ncbi:MAG TPA: elongation factor Ts [bacterium]|nr:elongation factor Ts [bacterium]